MKIRRGVAVAQTLAVVLLAAGAVRATPLDCRRYLETAVDQPVRARSLSPGDLVRLRDIGTTGDLEGSAPALALSPDHKMLAFQVRRADPETDSYCVGMVVMAVAAGARPLIVDVGEDPIRMTYDFRGKAAFPNGVMLSITPHWMPDGKAILFRKRDGGKIQVWYANVDGSGSWPVTASEDDVVDFSYDADRSAVRFSTQPGLRLGLAAIDQEGKSGFHYDGRFSPMSASRPFVPAPLAKAMWIRPLSASGHPAGLALATKDTISPSAVNELPAGPHGEKGWLGPSSSAFPPSVTLEVQFPGGERMTCDPSVCDRHVRDPWWTPSGSLRFFKSEGWGNEMTAVYEWRRGSTTPRRLFSTRDLLGSCNPIDDDIICLREASSRPRYISRLNLSNGRETALFDPNPEFASISLGSVERLHWQNQEGLQAYGDLVLPIGYRRGHRYPLIVVQYETRGFLRGGTGDEYPIQLFATDGYAVLSFNRPPDIGLFGNVHSIADIERADLDGFADRRSVQSALERGVAEVVRRGIADPARIGITGLSDGASTTQFELLNSSMFAVAEMSSCCWDASLSWSVGPRSMEDFVDMGYPGVLTDSAPFWKPISIARNADRVRVPILFQLADNEYLSALTAYTALEERHAPIDLYVFPDEAHIKWHPSHRLAIYRRSLAWFDFWLKGISPVGVEPEELNRWADLRAAMLASVRAADSSARSRPRHRSAPEAEPAPAQHPVSH